MPLPLKKVLRVTPCTTCKQLFANTSIVERCIHPYCTGCLLALRLPQSSALKCRPCGKIIGCQSCFIVSPKFFRQSYRIGLPEIEDMKEFYDPKLYCLIPRGCKRKKGGNSYLSYHRRNTAFGGSSVEPGDSDEPAEAAATEEQTSSPRLTRSKHRTEEPPVEAEKSLEKDLEEAITASLIKYEINQTSEVVAPTAVDVQSEKVTTRQSPEVQQVVATQSSSSGAVAVYRPVTETINPPYANYGVQYRNTNIANALAALGLSSIEINRMMAAASTDVPMWRVGQSYDYQQPTYGSPLGSLNYQAGPSSSPIYYNLGSSSMTSPSWDGEYFNGEQKY